MINCKRCGTEKIAMPGQKYKLCPICRPKNQREYHARNQKKRSKQISEARRKRHHLIRYYITKYLLEHPCVDCDEANPILLEFDHVRGEKKFSIGNELTIRSLDAIKKEIDKCEVRCVRCHRLRTAASNNHHKWVFNKDVQELLLTHDNNSKQILLKFAQYANLILEDEEYAE